MSKIINKILLLNLLQTEEGEFRRRKNEGNKRISDAARKRKIRFFGRMLRVENGRLTIFNHVYKNKDCLLYTSHPYSMSRRQLFVQGVGIIIAMWT